MIILEKSGKYVLKVYSHLDKAVQLTDDKKQAKTFESKSSADWFIDYMQLKGFTTKTR